MSIYNEGGKRGLMENINAALPFMDEDMRELAKRTLAKIAPLTENEYAELAISPLNEVVPGVSGLRRPKAEKSTAL